MSWYVTGFDKSSHQLVLNYMLPEGVDEAEAARIVGGYPELMYGEYLIAEYAAPAISEKYGIEFDFKANDYFLGYTVDR